MNRIKANLSIQCYRVGIVSFTISAAMILSGTYFKTFRNRHRNHLMTAALGIVYVQLLPSNDPTVIGLLVAGFGMLIFFGLWETFAPLREPLTPTRLFTNNRGRTLTAPFIVGGVVTMVRKASLDNTSRSITLSLPARTFANHSNFSSSITAATSFGER